MYGDSGYFSEKIPGNRTRRGAPMMKIPDGNEGEREKKKKQRRSKSFRVKGGELRRRNEEK